MKTGNRRTIDNEAARKEAGRQGMVGGGIERDIFDDHRHGIYDDHDRNNGFLQEISTYKAETAPGSIPDGGRLGDENNQGSCSARGSRTSGCREIVYISDRLRRQIERLLGMEFQMSAVRQGADHEV
jgi:hypothetical protein